MHLIRLARILPLLVIVIAARPAAAAPGAPVAVPWPEIGVGASASPHAVPPGDTVTYDDVLANSGGRAGVDVRLAHTLPAGFTYVSGSARIYRDGIQIASTAPSISGRTLTWTGLAAPPGRDDSFYGMNTVVQERCNIGYIQWQLDHTRALMGYGAWAKQLFYGITPDTQSPNSCWIDYVIAAYERGLKPVLRLQGEHGGSFWHRPPQDPDGSYGRIAQAFARVVRGLPLRDGHVLYIQIWNEPNLNLEWSGAANPTEYGRFLEQTAGAIRTATGGDPRIAILNAPLSPGGEIAPGVFLERMLSTVPNSRWAFDIWASNNYPGNYPPELNLHQGTALDSGAAIDSYVSEVKILASHGRPSAQVFLSETGYALGHSYDRRYPAITEANRADYMRRAFSSYWQAWPELIGVAPYMLSDPFGAWSAWNWVEADNARHAQYDSVQAIDKTSPYAAGRLAVRFKAKAASSAGTYASSITASGGNFAAVSLNNCAAVVVAAPPTPTATRTPTRTPTRTGPPTITPSRTPTPTPVAVVAGVVPVGRAPHGLAVDGDHGVVFVANHLSSYASVIDGRTGAVIRTIDLERVRGGNGAAYDAAADLLFIANGQTNSISRAPGSGSAGPADLPAGDQPAGLAVDLATGMVYAANTGGNTLSLLDGASGRLLREAPAGRAPFAIALDPDRGRFYATHHLEATVGAYDLATGDALKVWPTGAGPYGIAIDRSRNRLYTADRDGRSVTIVDLDRDVIVKHMPLNCSPSQVAVNTASGHLFAVCADDRQLHIYDVVTTLWLGWIPVGGGATEGIAVDEATGRVYISNAADDTVTIVQDSGPTIRPTPAPTRRPTATPTATSTSTPVLPGEPDRYEPDDTPDQAAALAGLGVPDARSFHVPGDVDWVRFTVEAGTKLGFRATTSAGLSFALAVYDADGRTLLAPPDGAKAADTLTWQAPTSGAYYLRVAEARGLGGAGASYILKAEVLTAAAFLPQIMSGVAAPPADGAEASSRNREPITRAAASFVDSPAAGAEALAVHPDAGWQYLASGGALTLRDPAAGRTLAHAAIGQQPGGILVDPAAGRAYVATGEDGAVRALDARTLAMQAISSGHDRPAGLALSGSGPERRLFVAETMAGTVRALAADDLRALAEIEVGPGPYAVAALPETGRVFVALTGGGGVAIVDSTALDLLGVTPLGGMGFPQGLVADPVGRRVYVVYALSPHYRQIAVLDGATGALVEVIPATLDRPLTGAKALALDAAGRRLLVSAGEGLFAYDLNRRAWEPRPSARPAGPAPVFGLAVDAGGDALLAAGAR